MDKSKIIANLSSLTSEQLFKEITEGNITIDELRRTGNFGINDPRYKEIKQWLSERSEKEDAFWMQICKDNKGDLVSYLSKYPKGKYIDEACRLIAICEQREKEDIAKKYEILSNLFSNKYSPAEIIQYIDNHIITENDLIEKGVPPEIINNLRNIDTPKLSPGDPPEAIPDGYTEVYFWGMQGSGKTTALAAILHMAEEQGWLQIAPGPGYEYALTLKNIFSNDHLANDYLPSPTSVETTQYLPFLLKQPKEKHSRSVSLMELSGEIFQCFLERMANRPFPTDSHRQAFNSLNNFLKSKNEKIHFFFIDYQRNNQKDSDGFKQSDYLTAAQQYFKNNQIFKKNTVAIYLVLTKSDLMVDENNNFINSSKWDQHAVQYVQERYPSFINYLKGDCKKYSINNGILTIEPFSLGKVFFQRICNFDGECADHILKILIERIRPKKSTVFDLLNK